MAGHNARIDNEKGYEKELAELLNTLGERGVNVEHATSVSTAFGGAAQTRASSVYLDSKDGNAVAINGLEPAAVAHAMAKRLATKLPSLPELLQSTKHKATYLHDVKALYLTHALQDLAEANVLVKKTVRVFSDGRGAAEPSVRPDICCLVPREDDDGAGPAADATDEASAVIAGAGFVATDYGCMMVPAEQAAEFDRLFWSWLRDVLDGTGQPAYTPIHGITCDLGYGHPSHVPDANPFAAQDADDEIALDVQMMHVSRQLKLAASRPNSASPTRAPKTSHGSGGSGDGGDGSSGGRGGSGSAGGISRPTSAWILVAPPLSIQIADETPLFSRWLRLTKWARTQRLIAGCPVFSLAQQPFKCSGGNRVMFEGLYDAVESAKDLAKTAQFTAGFRWLEQRCHFAANCSSSTPGHLDAHAMDALCDMLQVLSEYKTVDEVLAAVVAQTAPHMTITALQKEVRTRTAYTPTMQEVDAVLGCAAIVTEAGQSGGPGGLPAKSWSTVPAKLAAQLNLCPSNRKASKCVLAVKILETHWRIAATIAGQHAAAAAAALANAEEIVELGKKAGELLVAEIIEDGQKQRSDTNARMLPRGTVHEVGTGTGDGGRRESATAVVESPYQDGSVIVGFVADKYCPFTKSLAPNGVCFAGDSRYNPFFGSLEATVGLMQLYLDFCSENKGKLLSYTLSEMEYHLAARTTEGLLDDDAATALLALRRLKSEEDEDSTKAYITFRTTCQTWSATRDSDGFPQANFSCLVPHFQNAVTLSDAAIATLNKNEADAYARCLVNYMHTTMAYLKKFVDVDAFVALHSPPAAV